MPALSKDLMGVGMADSLARRVGYPSAAAITAAGTTTTDATVLLKNQRVCIVAGSGANGVRLPADAELMVPYCIMVTTGTAKIYPPTGGQFNSAAANTPIAIVVQLGAMFMRMTATDATGAGNWIVIGAVAPA